MAEEKKAGQGWEKNTDNTFKATLSVPKKPSAVVQTASSSGTSQNTNQRVRVIVNNETGAIQLYETREPLGDRLFNTFNPSTGKWESPSNDPQAFNEIQNRIGTDGIQKLQNQAKQGAINGVINPTSTNENKVKISSTEGYKSLSNTIKQDPNSGQVGPESFNQGEISQAVGQGKLRSSYGDTRYPLNMKSDQDYIKFTMYTYVPKTFGLTSGLGAFSGSNKGSKLGTVTLPIQPQISDSNSVTWGEDTINSVEAAAAATAYASITRGVEGAEESVNQAATGIAEQKGSITTTLAAGLAGKAVGANENFLSRVTGGILNNNVELLFQGPALRSFSFTFIMSAREPRESEAIRNIIRFFKQGMSVKRTESNLFLKAPNVFDIEYYHKNAPHKYINKIKTCALQNCSVNYTPDGNYATYEDGAMTQYSLTLSFGEIDPLYDDEYDALGLDHIGY
jgi:hypothetical protein